MKRSALVLVALALSTCSQTAGTVPAQLVGTHDIAIVDRYIFVTSTDNNELRVLDTFDPQARAHNFERAPNPLESLSIPVLDRPTEVWVDSAYGADGFPSSGQLVYATRSGAREISVIDASHPSGPDAGAATSADVRFREIQRLPLPAPLTSLATWHTTSVSRLYIATWDGDSTIVWAIELPTSPTAVMALDPQAPWTSMKAITSIAGETVPVMLAVPGLTGRTRQGAPFCAGADECLVIGSRASAGKSGRTVMLDPRAQVSSPLLFPQPVRMLVTHGTDSPPAEFGAALAAGQHVFGVLDEEACGGLSCGGVLAIDTTTADAAGFPIAKDASGLPMLPLSSGSGLIQGLTLATKANGTVDQADKPSLLLPASIAPDPNIPNNLVPVLGLMTSSNGDLLFFDGRTLEQIDTDPAGPAATEVTLDAPVGGDGGVLQLAKGPIVDDLDPHSGTLFGDGSWRSQQIVAVWQGVVGGVAQVPTTAAAGTHLSLFPGTIDRVRLGDTVTFADANGPCGTTTLAAIGPGAIDVAAIPSGCDNRTSFSVRAGPVDPIVVTATILGFLGRVSPNGTLIVPASPFAHLAGFDPSAPALRLPFGSFGADPADAPTPGMFWTITVDAHFAPYVSIVDTVNSTNAVNCTGLATLPSTPVYDAAHNLFFVVYPSGNGIVEVPPSAVGRGTIGLSNGLACWH